MDLEGFTAAQLRELCDSTYAQAMDLADRLQAMTATWTDEYAVLRASFRQATDLHSAVAVELARRFAANGAPSEWMPGDTVIWKGTAGLFRQEVTIAAVRNSYMVTLGQGPEDGRIVYDIRDPRHGIVYAISPDELEAAPADDEEPGPLELFRQERDEAGAADDLCYCMAGDGPHPYHGTPRA